MLDYMAKIFRVIRWLWHSRHERWLLHGKDLEDQCYGVKRNGNWFHDWLCCPKEKK